MMPHHSLASPPSPSTCLPYSAIPPAAGFPPKTRWGWVLRQNPSRLTCKRSLDTSVRRREEGLPCRPQHQQHHDHHAQQQQLLLDKNRFRITYCLPLPGLSDQASLVVSMHPGFHPLPTLRPSSTLRQTRTPPRARTPHRKSSNGPNSRAENLSRKEGLLREVKSQWIIIDLQRFPDPRLTAISWVYVGMGKRGCTTCSRLRLLLRCRCVGIVKHPLQGSCRENSVAKEALSMIADRTRCHRLRSYWGFLGMEDEGTLLGSRRD